MQREGIFREMKLRGHYEKPSERKVREKAEAIPPRPQTRAQEITARGPAADEAQGHPRSFGNEAPRARPPFLISELERMTAFACRARSSDPFDLNLCSTLPVWGATS